MYCNLSEMPKSEPNPMNTEGLTEEVLLCCDELCSILACLQGFANYHSTTLHKSSRAHLSTEAEMSLIPN